MIHNLKKLLSSIVALQNVPHTKLGKVLKCPNHMHNNCITKGTFLSLSGISIQNFAPKHVENTCISYRCSSAQLQEYSQTFGDARAWFGM